MLAASKLAVYVDEGVLAQVSELGEVIRLPPHSVCYRRGDTADFLYVVLGGDIFLGEVDARPEGVWIGPGDLIGVTEFLLDERRTRDAWAGAEGVRLWRLSRSWLYTNGRFPHVSAFVFLLAALFPHLQAWQEALTAVSPNVQRLARTHCNHTHPAIQQLARQFQQDDPWDTALAIWRFIRPIPYRFGLWHMLASDVLQQGYGMCTTKAILQTALMRACGLEAGFAILKVPSHYVRSLLPPGYRPRVGGHIKHIFSAVRLDNRWYPCDASFSDGSLVVMAREVPEVAASRGWVFERKRPFNIVGQSAGWDPFDFELVLDLKDFMGKRPFYSHHNLDAMNTLLDKEQGAVRQLPFGARQAQKYVLSEPILARQMAFATLVPLAEVVYRLEQGE
ncbi:MAG: hypothetical protein D6706_08515 [Chloroflexi bacterium]|nr:MAG: hypothetical protein D6706_08515 [Chloroflexota bacterium]